MLSAKFFTILNENALKIVYKNIMLFYYIT